MILTICITQDNAAFDDLEHETATILRQLADKVEVGIDDCNIMDSFGNSVGRMETTEN